MYKIKKQPSWVPNEGIHRATIASARPSRDSVSGREQDVIRLIFKSTTQIHPVYDYLAKRVYRQCDSHALIEDLEHLLCDDAQRVINLDGEIIPEALADALEGMPVEIEIEHHRGKNYNEPFCLVTKIRKPGGLIEDLGEAA